MTVSLKTVLELWAFLRPNVMSSETFNWARAATGGTADGIPPLPAPCIAPRRVAAVRG